MPQRTLIGLLCMLTLTACANWRGFETDPQVSGPTDEPQALWTADPYVEARERLVESGVVAYGIDAPLVVAAMRSVPRHLFVPPEYVDQAYANHPLPIGYGQTISQPYIVALMTQELDVKAGDVVLEIGTGSGFQAAILAELGVELYSMEIIEPLAEAAAERLRLLGYENVSVLHADGYFGWEEVAPFDAIIVTAAPDHVPPPLLDQLAIGGVMVVPVGPVGGFQELWRITRLDEDRFESTSLGGVRFVPLTREVDGVLIESGKQTTGSE